MEFFAIMFVGTLIAIWAVAVTRPAQSVESAPPFDFPAPDQGHRNAEIRQFEPLDEIEYWEAMELQVKDPVHNPCPSVPPRISNESF